MSNGVSKIGIRTLLRTVDLSEVVGIVIGEGEIGEPLDIASRSTKFCKAHGGGKRYTFLGCTRGLKVTLHFVRVVAEASDALFRVVACAQRVCMVALSIVLPMVVAKDVLVMVALRGLRALEPRERTEYRVRHGGGKRCNFDGCTKSAQGSTDFCKAHGGGNRSWGHADTSFGAGIQQRDRFVRSKTGLCSAHGALVQDHCVHGGGTLGPTIHRFAVDVKPTMEVAPVMQGPHEKINGDKVLLATGSSVPNSVVHCPVLDQSMIDPLLEGRVQGGRLLALLSRGGSSTSAGGSGNCASGM
ncbi:hypothetical protein U9M48_018389, partial [Paspalum notatum var. saurae]